MIIRSIVLPDNPVAIVKDEIEIFEFFIIKLITAISFIESFWDNNSVVSKTSFWRLEGFTTSVWGFTDWISEICSSFFQRICRVRFLKSAGVPKTAWFRNLSKGSKVRWIPLGIFSCWDLTKAFLKNQECFAKLSLSTLKPKDFRYLIKRRL